jgi:hypothetical protein
MVELGAILTGSATGRTDPEQISLFCSVGLAGTEVILAADLAGLTTVLPPREVAQTPPAVGPTVIDAISTPTDLGAPSLDGAGAHAAIPSQPIVETEAAAEALGDEKQAEVPGQAEPPFAEATTSALGNEIDGPPETAPETGDAQDTTAKPSAEVTEADGDVTDVRDAGPDAPTDAAEGAPVDATDGGGAAGEAATEATEDSAGGNAEGRNAGNTFSEVPQEDGTAHVDQLDADEADDEESLPPALAELMNNADTDEDDAAQSGDASDTGRDGAEATAGTEGSTEGESETTSMTADDDAAIAALQKAAARVVRPSSKKNRPRTRR